MMLIHNAGIQGHTSEQGRPTHSFVSILSVSSLRVTDRPLDRCIYMVDPSSVTTESARRAQSSYPSKVRSEATISYKPPDLSSMSEDSDSEDSDDESGGGLTMSPVDVRIIRRLSARANVSTLR